MAKSRKSEHTDKTVTIGWLIDVLKVYNRFVDPVVAEAIVQAAIENNDRSYDDVVEEGIDLDEEFRYPNESDLGD